MIVHLLWNFTLIIFLVFCIFIIEIICFRICGCLHLRERPHTRGVQSRLYLLISWVSRGNSSRQISWWLRSNSRVITRVMANCRLCLLTPISWSVCGRNKGSCCRLARVLEISCLACGKGAQRAGGGSLAGISCPRDGIFLMLRTLVFTASGRGRKTLWTRFR